MDHTNNIPSYLSEKIFRVYEPHIRKSVERWPVETEFGTDQFRGVDDNPISGNTFSARFRDAIASVLKFNWDTTIDMVKLRSMSGQHYISNDAATGSVWFRTSLRKQRPTQYVQEMRAMGALRDTRPAVDTAPYWKDWDENEVEMLCHLLAKKRFDPPLIVLDGLVSQELIQRMEERYPICFDVDEVKGRTMVVA